MRVGISEAATTVGGRDGRWISQAARTIEALGFHSMWVAQRIASAHEPGEIHPYGADRDVAALRQAGLFDTTATMAAAAIATTHLRLGSYVDLVALRHPLITAQQIATVDQLSDGRVLYGVGAGWYDKEFELLGVPFADRGRRVTEYLQAIKAVWTSDVTDFDGRSVSFMSACGGPVPVQKPHPPILIGGNSKATVARIAVVGDGWLGYGLSHDEVRRLVARIHEAVEQAGRTPSELTLMVGVRVPGVATDLRPDEIDVDAWRTTAEYVRGCEELGIEEVIVTARVPVDGYEDNMALLAEIMGVSPRDG